MLGKISDTGFSSKFQMSLTTTPSHRKTMTKTSWKISVVLDMTSWSTRLKESRTLKQESCPVTPGQNHPFSPKGGHIRAETIRGHGPLQEKKAKTNEPTRERTRRKCPPREVTCPNTTSTWTPFSAG